MRCILGMAAHQAGRIDAAIELFNQAISLDPEFPEAHNNLGSALKAQGKLEQAIAEFQKAIELDPLLPEAHSNLGIALSENAHSTTPLRLFEGRSSCVRTMPRLTATWDWR